MSDLHGKYGLRRVLNAYDKATHLGGARVPEEIQNVVAACLGDAFEIHDLQALAGERIARHSGAEWGCVTACAAAGITLGVAACMTGTDTDRIACLPDTSGMKKNVLIQKGHAISFGAPVVQMVRLSGAAVVEIGQTDHCGAEEMRAALRDPAIAAVVAVESYHTVNYDGLTFAALCELAHSAGVPVVVDAATQELRLKELVTMGPDLIGCSAHKYFCSTTAGIIAGRRDLVEAVLAQNVGIGRGMKVGKEGIFGVIGALDAATEHTRERWCAEEAAKIDIAVEKLAQIPGLQVAKSPDPNGCPFDRIRIAVPAARLGFTADDLRLRLAQRDPAVHVRIYGSEREAIYLNFTELAGDEVSTVCAALLEECEAMVLFPP